MARLVNAYEVDANTLYPNITRLAGWSIAATVKGVCVEIREGGADGPCLAVIALPQVSEPEVPQSQSLFSPPGLVPAVGGLYAKTVCGDPYRIILYGS